MAWEDKTKRVLQKYMDDDEAVVVCMAMFNRFKVFEAAILGQKSVAKEVGAMFMNDYYFLPSLPFWQRNGAVIYQDVSCRFFDFVKANHLLDSLASDENENIEQVLQASTLRNSFLLIADHILRLSTPFKRYIELHEKLYAELSAILEL